jgi:hypothetical protein
VTIGRPVRISAGIAHQKLGKRVRARGFARHGNPPFTASSRAGRKAYCRLPADCCQHIRKWARA